MQLTKKDLQDFRKAVRWWTDFLGLKDWDVAIDAATFLGIQEPEAGAFVAKCAADAELRVATIILNTDWQEEWDWPLLFHETAMHEEFEGLLLGPLQEIAEKAGAHLKDNHEWACAMHRIVRVVENCFFPYVIYAEFPPLRAALKRKENLE